MINKKIAPLPPRGGAVVEVRIHGRGGQGAVTAAELLAVAAFYDGKFAQAFPSFGVERRGAPLQAFVRISDSPIQLREQIYDPDYVIVQDSTLVASDSTVLKGIAKSFGIIINSEQKAWPEIKNKNLTVIDATGIALKIIGKPFINTALVGAFASISGLISEKSLERAIRERFSAKVADLNVSAMREAYRGSLNSD